VPALLVLFPFLGAAVALVCEGIRNSVPAPLIRYSVGVAGFASILSPLGVAIRVLPAVMGGQVFTEVVGGWSGVVGIELRLDGPAVTGVLTITVIALLIYWYLQAEGGYTPVFTFYYLVAVGGMLGLVLSDDLFNLFVFFEIVSLSAYLLIAYKKKPRALYAVFRYLVIGTIGMSVYLLGVFVVYRETGVLSLSVLQRVFSSGESGTAMQVAVAALLVGAGTRVACFPFHVWLPEAHGQAPHPVSALLSGIMIKAGFLTLYRIVTAFPFAPVYEIFAVIGPVTALFGVFAALVQTDMKKLLAYHSVSQMGYILTGFSLPETGVALYHMVNHAVFKSLLFLTVGIIITAYQRRNIYTVAGVLKGMPVAGICLLIGAASISGLPPFNGYASKTVLSATFASHSLYPLLQVASIGTVASFLKLSSIVLSGRGKSCHLPVKPAVSIYLPVGILSVMCVVLGVFPEYWAGFFSNAAVIGTGHTALFGVSDGFFSLSRISKTAVTTVFGIAVFRVVTAAPGKRLAAWTRSRAPGIDVSVMSVLYGWIAIVLSFMFFL
jgi:formate hydrogenlyase subunit 3/multisubunit Na+/H+ antiporter MnhD subunit